jgi:transposase
MVEVSLVHVIRFRVQQKGDSIRQVARDMGVSRNTVRKYLSQSVPMRSVNRSRRSPIREQAARRIEEIFEELAGRTTPKQRITGAYLLRRLHEEGMQVGRTTVQEILAERKVRSQEVYIPLVHRAGEEFQVDFFEVTVELAGQMQKAWKFVLHLPYSGYDFVWLYERCNQTAFLDGHVRGFEHLGGVPKRGVYDNLTAAVKRILGVERELTKRFTKLCSHYVFEPCFARPGEGHDKGAVENAGKNIRLRHLTPVPRGESLGGMAEEVQKRILEASRSAKAVDGTTVTERLEQECMLLHPLPAVPFRPEEVHPVVANRQSLVNIDGVRYSVPTVWRSRPILAHVGVSTIRFECNGESFTVKKAARGARVVKYSHYRKELARKPQALRQVAPELLAELGEPYGELWRRLTARHNELSAARVLSALLSIDETHQQIAVLLEKLLNQAHPENKRKQAPPSVNVPEALQQYQIESGNVCDYDSLLKGAS